VPAAEPAFGWVEAMTGFAAVAIAAFLVTWVVTERLRVARGPYVAILLALSLGLGAGALAWSGTAFTDLVAEGWGAGLLAGLAAAAVAVPLVGRLPRRPHARGGRLGGLLLWEGLVYGIAEAVLLATLPVFAIWQAAADLGWTTGGWAKTGSGALAVVAALVVILVHHLGYAEFRTRAARPKLAGALVTCGLQALAFLVTGNVLAPVVAHVVLHGQMLLRGVELPPAMPAIAPALTTADWTRLPSPGPDGARTRTH
jgi:hypothetical protein